MCDQQSVTNVTGTDSQDWARNEQNDLNVPDDGRGSRGEPRCDEWNDLGEPLMATLMMCDDNTDGMPSNDEVTGTDSQDWARNDLNVPDDGRGSGGEPRCDEWNDLGEPLCCLVGSLTAKSPARELKLFRSLMSNEKVKESGASDLFPYPGGGLAMNEVTGSAQQRSTAGCQKLLGASSATVRKLRMTTVKVSSILGVRLLWHSMAQKFLFLRCCLVESLTAKSPARVLLKLSPSLMSNEKVERKLLKVFGSVSSKSDEEELEHGSSPIIPYHSRGLTMNEVSGSAQCPTDKDSIEGLSDASSAEANEARNQRNLHGHVPLKDSGMTYHTEDGTTTRVMRFLPPSRSALEDDISDKSAVTTDSDVEPDSSQCTSHVQMDHVAFEAMPVEHSGCDTKKLAVNEGPQKATSARVTKESPDMEDLWDKELSREDDHVSDKKMPQADAQAEEISSTLETAQKRLPQTDHVVSALTQDQATDVTKSQMTSLKEAQGIVHPQAAQVVVVCQATALLTVHKCPQFTQTLTLPTSQVTVQTVYDPPQSGVMVTAAQMWEAPQARALPVAQVCTFEEAPISAPAAVQVGCTFETDLVLVPQAPQECALDVDQGTSVQTGQVSVFSSHVAGCKAGDGVAPISKTGSQSCAETSHYAECTAFPTSDELSHSTASQFPQLAPPRIVIDDVVVQKKCKVDVQPSPHVSDNQSGSEEAGNDDVPGDDSVAPNPSTGEVVVISSSVSMFARNMVGLPTCTLYTGKMEQQHKNVPTKEDSEERKKKAMDRLRKEREERVKQNTGAEKTRSATRSSFSKASKGVGDSDVRTQTHQIPHAVTKGLVLLSNVPLIFQEGAYVPPPSQEAMAKTIGKGGNGVVAYIYHGGREFAVKETGLRQEELETWSSVNHRNVIELCAVVVGDWDSGYPKTRRCYQMMPRMTGDLKRLLDKERPTLCHYFFDFKGDSERMNLVLGNAKYILLGVLNGLKHLHSLGIMHRDIKLQNILIDCHCQCRDIFLCSHDGDSGYGVFISDFDSALQVDRGREKLETRKLHGRPIKYSVHGTPGYRPPETSFHMFCEEVLPEWVSLKTDVWSFGTMVVRLFVGSRGPHSQREMATLLLADCLQSPTAAQTPEGVKISSLRQALAVRPDEVQKLQKVDQVEKHLPLAVDLYQLVQSCLTVNSEKRPTVGQVMGEPFFRAEQRGSESMATSAEGRGQGVGGCQITADSVAPSYEGKSRSPISRYNCTQKPMVQDN